VIRLSHGLSIIPPNLGSCIMELGILRDPSEPGRGNKLRPGRHEDVKTFSREMLSAVGFRSIQVLSHTQRLCQG